MLQVFIFILVIMLLLAIIRSSKSKTSINKSREKDDSVKRRIELEILISDAKSKGIDTTPYEQELNSMKQDIELKKDAAYKYIK